VHALCTTADVPPDTEAVVSPLVPGVLGPDPPAQRGGVITCLKRASLSLLHETGLDGLIGRSGWRRRRVLVLCYHGVSLDDEHLWNPRLYMPADTLRRRFETLRRLGCAVLSLGDALNRLGDGTMPPMSVVLTFDDGYHDFQTRAWPLLQEFGYPATVYLPTQRCEHNFPLVRLTLSYVLWKHRDATLDGRGLPGLDGRCQLDSEAARTRIVQALDRAMRAAGLGMQAKDDIVRQVMERLGLEYGNFIESGRLRLLAPGQVRALAGPLVDFQLHTHRHQTPADPDEFVWEIRENRERVEGMTGRPAVHFCYPSGVYRRNYPALLRREGVLSATTCDPGIVSHRSNPFLLPRFVDTTHVGDITFEGWVTGIADWLPHRHAAQPVAVE
jgi:peptidoglycan/xylan/chitin deacetylase (PgdA/CDA1 family)